MRELTPKPFSPHAQARVGRFNNVPLDLVCLPLHLHSKTENNCTIDVPAESIEIERPTMS
jgi:hypothetical protein